jgi:CheY-like chemotaxis protein
MLKASQAPLTSAPASNEALRGANVLLVDDDNAVREVTASILKELGCMVIEAGSGGAALDLLDRESIDLMIIDFAMPGMNGAEVAHRVQAMRPTLPILFVTGFADRTALEGVSEAYIVGKPFVDDELAIKARMAIETSGSSKVVRLRRKAEA